MKHKSLVFLTAVFIVFSSGIGYGKSDENKEIDPIDKIILNAQDEQVSNINYSGARNSSTVSGNVEKPNFTTATKPSTTNGNITENVGEDGKQFDTDIPPKRQFLSFQTSTGKEFHLIIDYTKDEQQVRMLTEVSESDLLNLIDKARKESGEFKENEETKEEMKARLKAELEEEIRKEEADKLLLGEENNKKGDPTLFIIIVLSMIIGGFGYYKKIYLKNKNSADLDEHEEEEEGDEYTDEYEESYEDGYYGETESSDYTERYSTSSSTSNELDIEKKNDSELYFEEGFEEDFEEEFNEKR